MSPRDLLAVFGEYFAGVLALNEMLRENSKWNAKFGNSYGMNISAILILSYSEHFYRN